jgi:hypothetical protein
MLKKPAEYERDVSWAKFIAISLRVSYNSQLGIYVGIFQKALVDE